MNIPDRLDRLRRFFRKSLIRVQKKVCKKSPQPVQPVQSAKFADSGQQTGALLDASRMRMCDIGAGAMAAISSPYARGRGRYMAPSLKGEVELLHASRATRGRYRGCRISGTICAQYAQAWAGDIGAASVTSTIRTVSRQVRTSARGQYRKPPDELTQLTPENACACSIGGPTL